MKSFSHLNKMTQLDIVDMQDDDDTDESGDNE